MYRRTSRQISLLAEGRHLPPSSRARLEGTWAIDFYREVFPVLLRCEDAFKDLYANGNGRPNYPVAVVLGILLLEEWFNLSDQAALDAFSFDLRWQVALGVAAHDAYLSRPSLVEFRQRLVREDQDMTRVRTVFDALSRAAIQGLKLGVAVQRLDSTRVVSNIQTRGRVDLFQKTLVHFLRWLKDSAPSALGALPSALRRWFEARIAEESWDGASDEKWREELQQLGAWLHLVIELFADKPMITASEPYQLVVRLFQEHCDLVEADEPSGQTPPGDKPAPRVKVRSKPKTPGTSLQSPFDPDAGYGHKGTGYHVQIAETCGNKDPQKAHYQAEIITDFEVHGAGVTDHEKAMPTVERLSDNGLRPDVLVVDTGYVYGATLVAAEEAKIELRGPVSRTNLPDEFIGRDAFTFDPETGHALACPEGHAPVRHVYRTTDDARRDKLHAKFDARTCMICPRKKACCVRGPNSGKGDYHLDIERDLRLRDERLTLQTTREWRKSYAIRSGIEATNSELKRHHGLGRLRVRRKPRVTLSIAFKLMACNSRRWLKASQAARGA